MRRTYALLRLARAGFLSCKHKIANLPCSHLTYVNVGRANPPVMKLGLHASGRLNDNDSCHQHSLVPRHRARRCRLGGRKECVAWRTLFCSIGAGCPCPEWVRVRLTTPWL